MIIFSWKQKRQPKKHIRQKKYSAAVYLLLWCAVFVALHEIWFLNGSYTTLQINLSVNDILKRDYRTRKERNG